MTKVLLRLIFNGSLDNSHISIFGLFQLKSESWGVNGHTTPSISPYPWSRSFGCVRLTAK